MTHANILVLASLSLAACVDSVPLDDKPCPCASGFECCEATNSCLAPGEPCLANDGGPSGDGATLAAQNAIGRPCDTSVDAAPNQGVYSANSACPAHLCLKPIVQPGAPGLVNAGPLCSAECTQDSDCDGELRDPTNPLDRRCAKGFTCGIPFDVGSLCCKQLCVCRDFLGPAGLPTPIACMAGGAETCAGTTGSIPIGGATGVGEMTEVSMRLKPGRAVDIVTMVDNSPSMAPKVGKLTAQFSKLIDALKDPLDGTLPDLRVAIINSDLGTGGAYASGSCGPKTLPDGTTSLYGDLGRFQMLDSPTPCAFEAGARSLEYRGGTPLNYSGDMSSVFACLTGNLGTLGCGEEHPLQAFEFALVAQGIGTDQQAAMLRPEATLGLIFLSDEDDCSAATNDGMFGDKSELRGESAGLRCATRAHTCGGTDLTVSPPGYPTTAAFTHAFSDCQARTDSCPNPTDGSTGTDTSLPTQCSPLKDIHTLASKLKALKGNPEKELVVAGIFGWPRNAADMASAQYKIAPVPNPNTADTQHPTVFDYWPVCYDPHHLPSPATTDPATGFDAAAAGWGATGGLRESAFIDEFGANGLKFSICEPDFATPLTSIGTAIARQQQRRCFDYKLIDTDSSRAGVQADCRVAFQVPIADPSDPTRVIFEEYPSPLPQCLANAVDGNVSTACWQLASDQAQCPATGQLVNLLRTADEIRANPQVPSGTKLLMHCRTCPNFASGSSTVAGCDY